MKKQFSLFLGAVLIAASLTGCGKDDKPLESSQPEIPQSTEQSEESQTEQQTQEQSEQ